MHIWSVSLPDDTADETAQFAQCTCLSSSLKVVGCSVAVTNRISDRSGACSSGIKPLQSPAAECLWSYAVGREWRWQMDDPDMIVEGAIEMHQKMIKEYRGVPGVKAERIAEGMQVSSCSPAYLSGYDGPLTLGALQSLSCIR